jgi:hypothetical protein
MKGIEVREKIAALVCLTSIAMVAMANIPDSENIVINVVVAIAAFISGGGGVRKNDNPPPTEYTQTTTETTTASKMEPKP